MTDLLSLSSPTRVDALVAFVDLTAYTRTSLQMEDEALASWMNGFYERLTELVEARQGVVVKFMGDGALVVFAAELAEQGVLCLLDAKKRIDGWLEQEGYKSRLEAKIHFGPVVAGPFGGKSRKTFDVLGKTVNAAATLEKRAFSLSAQAFRQLSAEGRKHFKKHTPPITYIRSEDRH